MVTTSWPSGESSVAGAFVRTLAERLIAQGHAVSVIAPAGGGGRPGRSVESGVGVLRVAYPGWSTAPFCAQGLPEALEGSPLTTLARAAPGLAALLVAAAVEGRAAGPQAVLVGHWLVPGGAIAQAAARVAGVEATTICHSGGVRLAARLPGPLARAVVRVGRGRGDFVATCEELVEILERVSGERLGGRAIVSPMPVPEPVRIGSPPKEGPFRLLALGRLAPIKGLDLLIEALAGLEGVELHVCGEGGERGRLEALARRLGVSATFHGVVLGEEKARMFSTCHGFALTSRRLASGRTEGAPVALMEAMSYGLPVVATRVGGVEGLVSGHGGRAALCEPEVGSIRRGVEALLSERLPKGEDSA